jgi:hypothetical protein
MNQPVSLFDDLASAADDAQQSLGGWAAVRARLESDGIAPYPAATGTGGTRCAT